MVLNMSVVQTPPQTRPSYEGRAQVSQIFRVVGPLENNYSSNYVLLSHSNVEFVSFLQACFHLEKP